MLPDFYNKTTDTTVPYGEMVANLLSVVQRVLNTQDNTKITLPHLGSITILPERREYHADVPDMRQFSIAPAANFEIKTLGNTVLPSNSQRGEDVRDLLWQLAFYIYEDSLIENCSENDVIQFNRWPNLTRLPITPNTARISALLTRHPTSIILVRRVLGIDKEEVARVISAAFSAGIVNTVSHGRTVANSEPLTAEVKTEQTQKTGLWHYLFAKVSGL